MSFRFFSPLPLFLRHFRTDASTSLLPSLSSTSTSTLPPKPKINNQTLPKNRRQVKTLPPLIDSDLIESFVRGSGPGGQAVQKSSNACSLIHLPTGIRIHCHETRSQTTNRMLARRRMQEKLDLIQNPGSSKLEAQWERARSKKAAKTRKGIRKRNLKAVELGKEDGEEKEEVSNVETVM